MSKHRYALMHPTRKPNTSSPAYKAGHDTAVAGGWWKGCPHTTDTQEYTDWQAGWKKAHQAGHCPVRTTL